MSRARLRQWWADLLASFWLRPAAMTAVAILLAQALVEAEGRVALPEPLGRWVYAGGMAGAREVLGTVAAACIGVAGTTFSITVAALTLASNQMGPRLLRNFTRDPGNGWALGAFVATFAYALVALRSVHDGPDGAFVPQIAVSVGLLLAFGCVGTLIWFLHHVSNSISVDRVVALVARDLDEALESLSRDSPPASAPVADEEAEGAALRLPAGCSGYLRVLDADALADWAVRRDAVLRLDIRPGQFAFPGAVLGRVTPSSARAGAEAVLRDALALGDARSVEQDPEYAVRQLVEIALRALPPGNVDLFTVTAVADRLGGALCLLAGRALPDGRVVREGRLRVVCPPVDYEGLVDAMFHMLRQGAASEPAVIIHLAAVFGAVAAVEHDPARRATLHRHLDLLREAAARVGYDASANEALAARLGTAVSTLRRQAAAPASSGTVAT
jgi:uncharacterized membrane protein